ncbi:HAD-IIIC family phosphatase [Streptomyces sp. HNM0663]|uniref:HAD-IIIC family phosphatase n=1 Tax=Streptomyces chengmaiensis TaxID=3040919 RepID=A0ABT6HPY3_9ACTN|nr:HAD-IIIC family phosphatase [Streptomyces chengmaiensis]MDH2390776.1 HAD-IIIC family phosphatase [Streptomyces chengmaiensis]
MTTRRDEAEARMRALHAAGALAASYPELAGLLTALDEAPPAAQPADDACDWAGRVLARLDPGEVLAAHPGTPVVRVAVTGRATAAGIVAPLTAQLARHGMLMIPYSGGHGGYVQELADPASGLYAHRPELTVCLLDPLTVWDRLPAPWQPYDVALEAERQRLLLAELAAAHRAHAPEGAVLVLNTVPLLRRFTHQLVSLDQRAELGAVWREFTADLLRMADPAAGVAVVDAEPLTASGIRADDPRLGVYADAPCTARLLAALARETAHLARARRGAAKKCLVLDLDGTLWDGVLAEDGPERVRAARSLRSGAFAAFRRIAEQLAAQGVLLAVCSKNDPEPVARALAAHPDWPLSADDFVSVVADWGPKADGIQKIAAELGISPSSVVFADDSVFEREAVRAAVPGAAVVPLDAEPALHGERLLADGWFDTPTLTREDRARADRYRQRERRERQRTRAADYTAFLRGLSIEASAAPAADGDTARIAQLTLRTNRFNLTGVRLTAAQVARRADDPAALVLAVRAADRFGDDGVVGAVLVHRDADGLHLENYVMSCRVLGRGIEDAVLAGLLRAARRDGLPAVHARWRPTAANEKLRGFLTGHGFTAVPDDDDDGGAIRCRHDLLHLPPAPDHIRLAFQWHSHLDRTGPPAHGRGSRSGGPADGRGSEGAGRPGSPRAESGGTRRSRGTRERA